MKRYSSPMSSLLPTAILALAAGTILTCCKSETVQTLTASGLNPENFATEVNGKPVALYTLTNANGMEAAITNYGGRIVSLMVPDRDGKLTDVVLGFDSIQAYFPENNETDFCAAIGRYANRIDHGRLPIDGDTIQLPVNNFGHTLHGGPRGWQYQVYDATQPDDTTLVLTMHSPDGDNGFPGAVTATVTYRLLSDNSLDISYDANTDTPTVINMTNHAYFALSGKPSQTVAPDSLYINASSFTPVDSTFMTTGEICRVDGTPFDFRITKEIGQDIGADNEQIRFGRGYDHNLVLDTNGDINVPAAILTSPASGIRLTVLTDEPGIQFYSGNFLNGDITGKRGETYVKRAAICLETQHYPDSPNKSQWPSTQLNPGETYKSHTIFKFSTTK